MLFTDGGIYIDTEGFIYIFNFVCVRFEIYIGVCSDLLLNTSLTIGQS